MKKDSDCRSKQLTVVQPEDKGAQSVYTHAYILIKFQNPKDIVKNSNKLID